MWWFVLSPQKLHLELKLQSNSLFSQTALYYTKNAHSLPATLESVKTLTSSRQQSTLKSRCSCEEGIGFMVSSLQGDNGVTSGRCDSGWRGKHMRDSKRDRHSAQVSESSTWSPFRLDSTFRLRGWLLDFMWGRFKLPWREKRLKKKSYDDFTSKNSV